jgi:hypothetical protein
MKKPSNSYFPIPINVLSIIKSTFVHWTFTSVKSSYKYNSKINDLFDNKFVINIICRNGDISGVSMELYNLCVSYM